MFEPLQTHWGLRSQTGGSGEEKGSVHYTVELLRLQWSAWASGRGLRRLGAGRFMSGKQCSRKRLGTISKGV